MKSEVYNIDCMEYMKTLPDKSFGLCIADPPFAVKYARGKNGYGVTTKNLPTPQDLKWDSKIPEKEFFDELLRVSNRVIIWGGDNTLPTCFRNQNAGLYGTNATA